MASCSATKTGIDKEEGGDVWGDGVSLPKELLCVMSPASLEVAELLLASGK